MAKRRTRNDSDLRLAPGVDAQKIARQLDQEHGCEGITMDARSGKVLGLRYRDDVASTHVEVDLEKFQQRTRSRGPRIYSFPPRRGRK